MSAIRIAPRFSRRARHTTSNSWSREKNALPLIITHGWAGSVLEQIKLIGPLTDPTAYGGKAALQAPPGLLGIHTNMPATVPADVDN